MHLKPHNKFSRINVISRKLFVVIGFCLGAILCQNANAAQDEELEKYKNDWKGAVEQYAQGNYEKSVLNFYIAAASGIPEGAHAMGTVYYEGKAKPRNLNLALKYYLCAAQIGYPNSQATVALFYEDGLGAKKSNEEAYFWLVLAASNKYTEDRESIVDLRNILGKRISIDSRERIELRAASWKPKAQSCAFK